mmetsp:Transcript_3990/g.4626  ORF Transcript_3990/g.4626 Transcript_3990/m.4626 type:complete len:206 (+) Transcript_3990:2121-2738(+)
MKVVAIGAHRQACLEEGAHGHKIRSQQMLVLVHDAHEGIAMDQIIIFLGESCRCGCVRQILRIHQRKLSLDTQLWGFFGNGHEVVPGWWFLFGVSVRKQSVPKRFHPQLHRCHGLGREAQRRWYHVWTLQSKARVTHGFHGRTGVEINRGGRRIADPRIRRLEGGLCVRRRRSNGRSLGYCQTVAKQRDPFMLRFIHHGYIRGDK